MLLYSTVINYTRKIDGVIYGQGTRSLSEYDFRRLAVAAADQGKVSGDVLRKIAKLLGIDPNIDRWQDDK